MFKMFSGKIDNIKILVKIEIKNHDIIVMIHKLYRKIFIKYHSNDS